MRVPPAHDPMKSKHLFLLPLFLCAAPLHAQDEAPGTVAAETLGILGRAAETIQQPWSCDLVFDVASPGSNLSGHGQVSFFQPRMFKVEIQMKAKEGMEEDASPQDGSIKVVADGDDLYAEIGSSQGTQILKLSLDLFEEMADSGQMPIKLGDMGNASSLKEAIEKLGGIKHTESTVDAKTTRIAFDMSEMLGKEASGDMDLHIDLDTQTGFPKVIAAKMGDQQSLSLHTTHIAFPEDMDPASFTYTPPKGTMVMDLTPMIRAQMANQQAGDDSDDGEF